MADQHLFAQQAQDTPASDLQTPPPTDTSTTHLTDLITQWNRTSQSLPDNATIPAMFAAQADQHPEAIALIDGETVWSYREVEAKANRLARWLLAHGITVEVAVGVCLHRSAQAIIAVLAILKAGGVHLPLDPTYPADRLHYMIHDSGAHLILTTSAQEELIEGSGAAIVHIDELLDHLDQYPESRPDVQVSPENAAYNIYTSGSTGRPKGTIIPHKGIIRLVWNTNYVEFRPGDTVSHLSNLSFDATLFEIWGALCNGARLLIISQETAINAHALEERLRQYDCSIVFLPTALFNQLAGISPHMFASLRYLVFGGEAADPKSVRAVLASPPQYLVNGYGPTENTTFSITHTITTLADDALSVPIGHPIANSTAYILDNTLRPVPIGEIGELYLGGLGLARGYLNQPDMTCAAFVSHPFGEPGERLYKTGDRARYLPDGIIEFVGRNDNQVKIRGFRVELNEIETVLTTIGNVEQGVVTVLVDPRGEKRIVAYVVPSMGTTPRRDTLLAALRARLPDYMLPSLVVFLDALPLTANGKVDRRALPPPNWSSPAVEREYVAPTTDVAIALVAIWQEVLHLDQVGMHDNFFLLGGHSLLAMQAVARIRERLQRDLSIQAFFAAPSLAEMAAAVESERSLTAQPPLKPAERVALLPLSFAQERLWFLEQLEPGNPFYNVAVILPWSAPADVAALSSSLAAMVRRHESLRTTFAEVAGVPYQIIHDQAELPLEVDDIAGLPPDMRKSAIEQRAAAATRAPFDLTRGPLAKAILLRTGDTADALILIMHHIVTDGWSMDVLALELYQRYRSTREDRAVTLPDLPIHYVDYAVWQREWLQGQALEEQIAYWRDQLAGAPVLLDLPHDRPRPATQSHRGARMPFTWEFTLSQQLRELALAEGATLTMALMATFQLFLSRYSGQQDIVVGVPVAGRVRPELEDLIGFFVNTLAMRARIDPNMTFRQLLAQVKATAMGAYDHQDVPFELVVDALNPERSLSYNPLFQVMFASQNTPNQYDPNLPLAPLEVDAGTARFDLTMFVWEIDDHVEGTLEYSTDLFDATTIRRMLGHFEILLAAIAGNPDGQVACYSLVSRAERDQLLFEWNATATTYPTEHLLTNLWSAQVAATPDAIALRHDQSTLTFLQLDRQANHVAHLLRAHSVGPESFVGICLPRSPSLVAALLGVLKAGGAYVPIDPTYPAERIAFIINDARCQVVLTQSAFAHLLPPSIDLLMIGNALPEVESAPPDVACDPAQPAYAIYTSGSTGTPKGVVISHAALLNYVQWATQAYITDGKGSPLHSPVAFDLTVTGLWVPLLAGQTITLLTDGDEIVEMIDTLDSDAGYTLVKLTPAHLDLLAQSGQSLDGWSRALVVGGEALLARHIDSWRSQAPQTRIINEYGPTEATVGCCVYDIPPDTAFIGNIPIGRPIANMKLFVLDDQMEPAPIGVAGELYIGGAGLARGYLRRPDLTAERFVPHPFATSPGERLYRTGDRVRWRADGLLEYLGRTDEQVKVRGYRIEPGEIVAALRSSPDVQDAAVIVAGEEEPHLVGYFVPASGATPDWNAIRAHLRARLPHYMLPVEWGVLDRIPLTANGKVDRRQLPPPLAVSLTSEVNVHPRTPEEAVILEIWRQVLRRESIGVTDNFFEIGGHSLLATQVISRMRERFGGEIPLRLIFEDSTVAGMAAYVVQNHLTPVDSNGGIDLVPVLAQRYGDIDALLKQIEQLSDDEARALLEEDS